MIQYQTLNPYDQIMPGVQTGFSMKLASAKNKREEEKHKEEMESMRQNREMARRPSDAIIADPGQYEPVKIGDATQDVKQDLEKYYSRVKDKNFKKLDEQRQSEVLETDIKNGVYKTDIGKELVKNNEFVEPDEVARIYKSIVNGTPEAEGDLQLLFGLTGSNPENPNDFEKAFRKKMGDIKNMEKANKEQRGSVLKQTLLNIGEYHDNPKAYQGKTGITNPQTKKVVDNELNYLKELAAIDPQWAKDYWDKRKSKGGTMRDYAVTVKDPKTGKLIRRPYAAPTVEGYRNIPGAYGSTARKLEAEGLGTSIFEKSGIQTEDRKREMEGLPKPQWKGQKANDSVYQQYREVYGNHKDALKKIKEDGWK
jgi:hypothetical protein